MLVGRPSIPMVCTSKAGSAAAWVSLIVPGRARGRMIERAASWKLDLASVPIRVDQFSDRVDDPAADSEQDHPHQIRAPRTMPLSRVIVSPRGSLAISEVI